MLARLCCGAVVVLGCADASAACPPAGTSPASLETLKHSEWKVDDDARRQRLALELLDCLGAPDPTLRDELAFGALARWSRERTATASPENTDPMKGDSCQRSIPAVQRSSRPAFASTLNSRNIRSRIISR